MERLFLFGGVRNSSDKMWLCVILNKCLSWKKSHVAWQSIQVILKLAIMCGIRFVSDVALVEEVFQPDQVITPLTLTLDWKAAPDAVSTEKLTYSVQPQCCSTDVCAVSVAARCHGNERTTAALKSPKSCVSVEVYLAAFWEVIGFSNGCCCCANGRHSKCRENSVEFILGYKTLRCISDSSEAHYMPSKQDFHKEKEKKRSLSSIYGFLKTTQLPE